MYDLSTNGLNPTDKLQTFPISLSPLKYLVLVEGSFCNLSVIVPTEWASNCPKIGGDFYKTVRIKEVFFYLVYNTG